MKSIFVIAFCLVLCSCDQDAATIASTDVSRLGGVSMSFEKSNVPSSVSIIKVLLSRSGYASFEKSITIGSDTSSTIYFDQIPIGTWTINVHALNDTGLIVYSGTADAVVMEGVMSIVNISMSQVTSGVGGIQVNVSWSNSKSPLFPKNYGGSGREYAMCVSPSMDGGYILGGISYSQSNNGDACLVKVNSRGDLMWTKYYGATAEDRINDIISTEDGGYVFVGYSTGADEDSWAIKIDSIGNILWEKKFGLYGSDALLKIKKGYDGTLWACGYCFDSNLFDGRIVKMSPTGDILWSQTYGGSGGDFAMNILPLKDGNAVVVGNNGSVYGKSYDFWAFKVDAEGKVVWEKNYGGANDDRVAGICIVPNGGYILTGYTTSYGSGNQDAWIMKIDESGALNWSLTQGGAGTDYLLSVENAIDNSFTAAGISSSFGGAQQGWVIKMDYLGNLKWSKTYGGAGYEGINEHVMTKDGGFVFAGSVKPLAGGSEDFWCGKANLSGVLE